MKVINLNESQYKRLFEIADYSENDLPTVPTSISPSETPTMIKGATSKQGEPDFVGDEDSILKNHLQGSKMKSDAMSIEYPHTNRGVHY